MCGMLVMDWCVFSVSDHSLMASCNERKYLNYFWHTTYSILSWHTQIFFTLPNIFQVSLLHSAWPVSPLLPQHSQSDHLCRWTSRCHHLLHPHQTRCVPVTPPPGLWILVWCWDLCLHHLPSPPPHSVRHCQLLQGVQLLQSVAHASDPGHQDQHWSDHLD